MSQSFTIELPVGLPLLNANRRTHHHVRAVRTRTIRAAAIEAVAGHSELMSALAAAKPNALFQRARIVGYYRPARAGRADPANWYPSFKAAVDGLVDAGLLEDDDHTRLIGPDMRLGAKTPGGQLMLVINDATHWSDTRGQVDVEGLKADWSRFRGRVLQEAWEALRDAEDGPLIDGMRAVNELLERR